MLSIKHGDLFKHATKHCVIAHGCNAQGKMGSGFAYELRLRHPEAYLAYHAAHKQEPLAVGTVIFVVCRRDVVVANCITQEFYGRDKRRVYVDYDAVDSTLHQVAHYAKINDRPVHLPFIGGGLANGDPDKLRSIFTDIFDDVDATLWLKDEPNGSKPSYPLDAGRGH